MIPEKSKKQIRVYYGRALYGNRETRAVAKLLRSGKPLAGGEYTKAFETKVARLFGKRFGVFLNSGSSGNLIALELLNLPKGSEVITPLLTFGTTLAPIIQKGLVPAFADVLEGSYIINTKQVKALINKKTRALLIPSLLGNIPNMKELRRIAKKHKLYFIEDSCDTLGARFAGQPTGSYSDITTTSFYASHIITSGGTGGMVMVNDQKLLDRARMFRGWGRSSSVFAESEDVAKRFKTKLDGIPYDAKFIFKEVGYNFLAPETGAVFGLEQLKRLGAFAKTRTRNFNKLYKFFSRYKKFFILPQTTEGARTNWLAFPLTIRENAPFNRMDLVMCLEKAGIQTRPIFTGNVLKHPAFKSIPRRTLPGGYPVTNGIMKRAFVIGCHQAMTTAEIEYIQKTVIEFLIRKT